MDNQNPVISDQGFTGRQVAVRLTSAWELCVQDHIGDGKIRSMPPVVERESDEDCAWPEERKISCEEQVAREYRGPGTEARTPPEFHHYA